MISETGQQNALVDREDLKRFCRDVLIAAGAGSSQADQVAAHLVMADSAGRWSHGVHLLAYYLQEIEDGLVDPRAVPSEEPVSDWAIRICGHRCFGQCAALAAVQAAIRMNSEGRPAFVPIVEAGHIGRLEPYVRLLADAGSLALMTSAFAGNERESAVSAYAGGRRILGTNPIAVSGPGPFAIDVSTSQISVYQILLQKLLGNELPAGAIVASDGAATVFADAYISGGSVLTAGAHKGLALSIASVLIGALGGTDGFGGTMLLSVPVSVLTDLETYRTSAESFAKILGVEANASEGRIHVSGMRTDTAASRIQLPVPLTAKLLALASQHDVKPITAIRMSDIASS